MELSDKVKDTIHLERVKIVEETDSFFRVEYAGKAYDIAKSTESSFDNGTPESAQDNGVEQKGEPQLEQRVVLISGTEVFQDDKVPMEYKEVMMFHELRKMEYQKAGFEDAHERAVNDELFYVIKFFDEKTREEYVEFARKYRATREKSSGLTDFDVSLFYNRWKNEVQWGYGEVRAYKTAESLLKGKTVTPGNLDALMAMLHTEPAVGFSNIDREIARGWYSQALLSAVINRIPDSEGEVSFTMPPYYVADIHDWCMDAEGNQTPGREVQKEITTLFTTPFQTFLKRKNVTIVYDKKRKPIKF